LTQFHVVYGALFAGLFAILKIIFTNNETSLLNKNKCAKVCRMLFMHWFVYFFLKGRLHGAPTLAGFFNAVILSRVWE